MTDQIHPNYTTVPRPQPPRKTIGEMSLWELWCSLWQVPAREQAPRERTVCSYDGGDCDGRSDDSYTTAQQSDNDEDGDAG